jgi:hypothetical protein
MLVDTLGHPILLRTCIRLYVRIGVSLFMTIQIVKLDVTAIAFRMSVFAQRMDGKQSLIGLQLACFAWRKLLL